MQIHLSDITDSEGKIIKTTAPLEMDSIHFQLGDFPILLLHLSLQDIEFD